VSPSTSRRVLLASGSPRRRELLRREGIPFDLVDPGPEPEVERGPPERRVLVAARSKALGARVEQRCGLLLAADTVVVAGDRCLGKPRDRGQAGEFLAALIGRTHEVWTGLVFAPVRDGVLDEARLEEVAARAEVAMRSLTAVELEDYLDSGDWRDKAGAYGIQSRAGRFTSLVSGELETVIGLPMQPVREAWLRFLDRR